MEIKVKGMMCPHCEKKVVKALTEIGLENVNASFETGIVNFENPKMVNNKDIKVSLKKAGYKLV